MRPPFEINALIVKRLAEISRVIGFYEGLLQPIPKPVLRKKNRVRSIQGSLAIEGNTLSLEQVTAIIEGKRVIGPRRDIIEVQNAIQVYEQVKSFDPISEKSFLKAHRYFMKDLIEDAGKYRSGDVGVFKGHKVIHAAPQSKRVPKLMNDLFRSLKLDRDNHPIIKSCYFHYELEFIHPFTDGNGRMGRFWQHVLLVNYHPLFEVLPVESIIQEHQDEYYKVLAMSDQVGHSTSFIEFCLEAIINAIKEFVADMKIEPHTAESRLEIAQTKLGNDDFSRKDYLDLFKTLSTASASRDLTYGVKKKLLRRAGDKAITRYRFK